MEYQEFEGKTTEEAIELACAHFDLPQEKLDIEILSVGSPGLFGLGGRKARIRAALREEGAADLLPQAKGILEQMLELMGKEATVEGNMDEDERVSLQIDAEDAGLLIGKQGQTLEALQYLLTKMVAKKTRRKVRVVIDIESYRARHQESLTQLALKSGEKAKRTGKPITLNPMNPHDRRIVHLALQGDKELKTMSRGEGLYKKVMVYPVRKKEGQEDVADSP
jgi:spoIIIJ-associated protein